LGEPSDRLLPLRSLVLTSRCRCGPTDYRIGRLRAL